MCYSGDIGTAFRLFWVYRLREWKDGAGMRALGLQAVLAAGAVLALTRPAAGSYIIYSDRAAFEAQLVSKAVYGFDPADWGRDGISADGQVHIVQASFVGFEPGFGYVLGVGGDGLSIAVQFRDPQQAVGLHVVQRSTGSVVFVSGGHFEQIAISSSAQPTFIGIVSANPLEAISRFSAWDVGPPGSYVAFDSLTLGTVPEPSGLLALGPLLLALRRWRQMRRQNS